MDSPLTWLCALPALAGLIALSTREGARAVACGAGVLTFLLALALGLRHEAGAAPVLRAEVAAIASARSAQALGHDDLLVAHVSPLLVEGLDAGARQRLAAELSGRRSAILARDLAQASEDVAAIHSASVLLEETSREERRLLSAFATLEGELAPLRSARDTSLGDASYAELRAWVPAARAHWFVALSGQGIVFALAIALLSLACSLVADPSRLGAIQLGTALLLLAAVAQDGLLFAAAWIGFVLSGALLLAAREPTSSDEEPRADAIRFLVPGLLGGLCVLGTVLWLGARSAGHDLAALLRAAAALDPRAQAGLLLPLLLACATRLPFPPFHGWLPVALSQSKRAGGVAFLHGGSLLLAGLGLAKLVLPCGPAALADARVQAALLGLGLIATTFLALAALGERDLLRQAGLASAALSAWVLAGVACGQGASAGALLECASGSLVAAGVVLAASITARRGGADALALGGVGSLAPKLASASALGALFLAGAPLSPGFAARAQVLGRAWELFPGWVVLLSVAPLALLALGLWWSYQRVFLGPHRGAGRFRDLDLREAGGLAIVFLALLLVGVDPLRWLALLAR